MPENIMDNYVNHYQLLGIRPGDSWQKLRRAYKSQMRRWHPDRFGLDDPARRQAEERTKEINRSYQELADFYHQNGKLPLDTPPRPAPVTAGVSGQADTAPDASTSVAGGRTAPSSPDEFHGMELRPRLIIALILAVVVGYVFWGPAATGPRQEAMTASTLNEAASTAVIEKPEELSSTGRSQSFGIGSTLGEVYSIQGVPDLVEGNAWHYGKARVLFQDGRVTSWIDTQDNRLKVGVAGTSPNVVPTAVTFGLGSTRDEVRAIQGSPLRESDKVWDYGLSRVYFNSAGRVTSWHESPMNPLRVNH